MIPGYTKEAFIKLAAGENPPAYTRTRPKGVKLRHMPSINQMYDAYEFAETGSSLKPGETQYWRRTSHAPEEGSSAFGPVQITKSLVYDAMKYHPSFKARYGKWYGSHMEPMQKNFLKFGKEPHLKGYDINYEYGGHGYWDPKHNDMYKQMGLDLMRLTMKDAEKRLMHIPRHNRTADDRINAHIGVWRGASKSKDKHYYDKVLDNLYSRYPALFDDFDESTVPPAVMSQRNARLAKMNDTWIYR